MILYLLVILNAIITIGCFVFIIGYIVVNGVPYLSLDLFSWTYTSDNSSMLPAILNTLSITVIALLVVVPLGIFAAIYLTEYANKNNTIVKMIRLTTETLTGIPSIIYGLFGMLFFNSFLGWRYSILSGAFTLAIMVLPVIIRTTEEALLAVPDSYREASFGIGAGKLRTIFNIVLPPAAPGILGGVILAIGRMMGETAALIYTSGTVAQVATNLFSSGRTLSVHMYSLSREGMHVNEAYATAVVLVLVVLFMNWCSGRIAKRLLTKTGR